MTNTRARPTGILHTISVITVSRSADVDVADVTSVRHLATDNARSSPKVERCMGDTVSVVDWSCRKNGGDGRDLGRQTFDEYCHRDATVPLRRVGLPRHRIVVPLNNVTLTCLLKVTCGLCCGPALYWLTVSRQSIKGNGCS